MYSLVGTPSPSNKQHHHSTHHHKENLPSPRLPRHQQQHNNISPTPPRIIVSRSPSPSSNSSSHEGGASSMSPISFCSDISLPPTPIPTTAHHQEHRYSDTSSIQSPSQKHKFNDDVQQQEHTIKSSNNIVQIMPPADYSPPSSPETKGNNKKHPKEDNRRFMTPSPQPVLRNLIKVLTDDEEDENEENDRGDLFAAKYLSSDFPKDDQQHKPVVPSKDPTALHNNNNHSNINRSHNDQPPLDRSRKPMKKQR